MSLLSVDQVRVAYVTGGRRVEAVRGVSLEVARGERVGIVGESGSGKSTLAKAMLGLVPLAAGSVRFDGVPVHGAPRSLRARFQPVFQDAGSALDPRWTIGASLAEPLEVHGRAFTPSTIDALLEAVQLRPELKSRLPRELSAGQRQRVNIARALALEPELLILDEPVSALDVSVQAQVLNLLDDLARARSLTLVFISHDLAVVAHLCTRVAVMHGGLVVEQGASRDVLGAPRHEYTQRLVTSAKGAR